MGTTNYAPRNLLAVRSDVNGADATITATRALLIVDVSLYATATNAMGTLQVQANGGNVTNAMACATDTNVARAGTIDDARNAVAAAGTITVARANAAAGNVTLLCLPG